jgi:hypothetical protein
MTKGGTMKKNLIIAAAIAAFGLAGCIVVPAYPAPYGNGYNHGSYGHHYY